jgi:hypothetical protein
LYGSHSPLWAGLGEKEEATGLGRASQMGKLLTQHCVRYAGSGLRGSFDAESIAGICFVYFCLHSALFIVDLKLFGFKDACEKFRSSTLGQPPQGQHEIL